MSIGVSKEEFWESCPVDLECYDLANIERVNQQNYLAWLGGYYVHSSLCAVVSNLFGESSGEKHKYLEKPVDVFKPDEIEMERRKQQALKEAFALFDRMIAGESKEE